MTGREKIFKGRFELFQTDNATQIDDTNLYLMRNIVNFEKLNENTPRKIFNYKGEFGTPQISISNIPQTYKDLRIICSIRSDRAGQLEDALRLIFNDDNAANYDTQQTISSGAGVSAVEILASSAGALQSAFPAVNAVANSFATYEIVISDYTSTKDKSIIAYGSFKGSVASGGLRNLQVSSFWRSASPITKINFNCISSFVPGSTVSIYGVGNNRKIDYRGAAVLFKDKYANPSALTGVMECTTIVDGDQVDMWYQDNGQIPVRYAYSTDAYVKDWTRYSAIDPVIPSCRFPYTFKYNGKYYTLGALGIGLCLWESTDKINWTILNGGNPIIYVGTGVWTNIWNPCVVIIGETLHVWIEAGTQADQSDVGLVHTSGTLANLGQFETNKSAGLVIPGGGNPWAHYVPERNLVMIIHGNINDPADSSNEDAFWTIRASFVNVSLDFNLAASYYKSSKEAFYIYEPNVHICDPQLVELPAGKNSKILFNYSYNQGALNQAYADVRLLDLLDAIYGYAGILV